MLRLFLNKQAGGTAGISGWFWSSASFLDCVSGEAGECGGLGGSQLPPGDKCRAGHGIPEDSIVCPHSPHASVKQQAAESPGGSGWSSPAGDIVRLCVDAGVSWTLLCSQLPP